MSGFSTLVLKMSDGEQPYVEFHVDGEDLGQRVKAALGDAGFDDGLLWYGGDYSIDDTVLGERVRREGTEGAILFACGCGYFACSGVVANVTIEGDTLTIRDISTWHNRRRVAANLGPIVFDRRQFDVAVLKLESAIAAWNSRKNSGPAGEQ